jgi:6-phosphofructokinase 1
MVVEVFGRYAGHTAFRGGIASDADCILIPEIPVNFDVVYDHYKQTFMRRIMHSDVKAGTYLILVAEGITNADGTNLTDESSGLDAFGHKKLSGAASYVRKNLEAKLKKDPEMKDFMKKSKMFIEGMYEIPEIREVNPGHLVRCGESSAYDVSFGRQIGAAAVELLLKGYSGVTVTRVNGNNIHYMNSKDAIKQRYVDLSEISLYESLGICFGRKHVHCEMNIVEDIDTIDRIY